MIGAADALTALRANRGSDSTLRRVNSGVSRSELDGLIFAPWARRPRPSCHGKFAGPQRRAGDPRAGVPATGTRSWRTHSIQCVDNRISIFQLYARTARGVRFKGSQEPRKSHFRGLRDRARVLEGGEKEPGTPAWTSDFISQYSFEREHQPAV
jgi:hypothetical protein